MMTHRTVTVIFSLNNHSLLQGSICDQILLLLMTREFLIPNSIPQIIRLFTHLCHRDTLLRYQKEFQPNFIDQNDEVIFLPN